jgi:hypothetical protein
LILAFTDADRWRPGIGDPTFLGWFTVVGYFVATCLAFQVAWKWHRQKALPEARSVSRFWYFFSFLLLFLGNNKQLDLQTWFTLTGRRIAIHQGWYTMRRPVQLAFIVIIALCGTLASAGIAWWLRKAFRHQWLALAGGAFLWCFVLVRASSFHHVDQFLGFRLAGFKMNWILELGGIACVIFAASAQVRALNRAAKASPAATGPV